VWYEECLHSHKTMLDVYGVLHLRNTFLFEEMHWVWKANAKHLKGVTERSEGCWYDRDKYGLKEWRGVKWSVGAPAPNTETAERDELRDGAKTLGTVYMHWTPFLCHQLLWFMGESKNSFLMQRQILCLCSFIFKIKIHRTR